MPPTTLADSFLAEFEHECQSTRRMLERVPEDRFDWKPHEKSMSLGRLATHVAELPDWGKTIVDRDELDMGAGEYEPRVAADRDELIAIFEKSREEFKKALEGRTDDHLTRHWRLLMGEHEILDLPRAACIRDFVLCHIIHHRGQLSVFLRLLDVPVPGTYGPTADEPGDMS